MSLSVVIASLDEQARVERAVRSAFVAGASEVLLADGGSTDGTVAIARAAGARIVAAEGMRAAQFNAGAAAATGDTLLFLHADTTLPASAASDVELALSAGATFGGFRLRFEERAPKLRIAERMINFRTRLTRCPWGDQAQFIRRATFLASGGFRPIPLMEDYELAIRMKRSGRSVLLGSCVTTSGRRFLAKGVLRTAWTNWRIIVAYRMGADPAGLARIYRS